MWEYLGLIICMIIAMMVKFLALRHRLNNDQFVFIAPEIFAEQWLEEAEKGKENSIYFKLTSNLENMNDLVIYNLKVIKESLNKSTGVQPEILIESLRKICIIIAVIQIKHESQQYNLVNSLKSISNAIFIRQDILQLLVTYCNNHAHSEHDKQQALKVNTIAKYREYIFSNLSHYMFPY